MKKLLSIALLSLLSVAVTKAQDGEAIADKCVEAMGGLDNWKALKSIKQTINVNQQGVDIAAVQIRDAKDRLRTELTVKVTKMKTVHDGKTVWWTNPFQGITEPTLMPEAMAKESLTLKMLDPMINWRTNGSVLSYEGEEVYKEEDCYKLNLKLTEGFDFIYLISKESHLIIVRRVTTQAQGFDQVIDSYYSDYTEKNGVMLHGKEEMIAGGVVARTITIRKTEFDVETTDDMFAFPGN